ncbi:MAG: HAMP domain-containing histidine kinase [Deltaproteobacteria bacterium]|nr:HAMP domain-containing histidine kinase [Deltaproteobacteria bacterium]
MASQVAMAFENARLYGELAERLRELTAARDQLLQAEKLAVVAALAGGVAHEINNPLAYVRANLESLIGYHATVAGAWRQARQVAAELRRATNTEADALAEKLVGSIGDEARAEAVIADLEPMVRETLEGVRRITDLVGGFRSLAAPPVREAPEFFDLGEMARACLPWLSTVEDPASARGNQVTLRVHDVVRVRAAPNDVRTAIENVFSFFRRRMMEVSGGEGESVVDVEASSGGVTLTISSTAFVLSDEERHQVFDPRLGVDSAHGRRLKLDVDLTIASQLIRRNGGDLIVARDKDRGTVFEISIPNSSSS